MKKFKSLSSRLKQTITIQELISESDGAGGYNFFWKDYAILAAEIIPINDIRPTKGEFYDSMQIMSYGYFKITIRYQENIDTKMRVKFDNKIFNIKRVINEDFENISLILIVEDGVDN